MKNYKLETLRQIIKYLGIYFVSAVLISFAISKFFNVQFQIWNVTDYTPLKYLSDMDLAWAFFGRSYNYNLFLGTIEFFAGVLILFDKTRLIGLLLALGIYLNVVIIDYEFNISDALGHALLELGIIILLLIPYLKDLKIFFWDMAGKFASGKFERGKFIRYLLPITFIILISSLSIYTLKDTDVFIQNKTLGAFEISEFSLNNENLSLGQGLDTKVPMIFFEFNNRCILSAKDSIFKARYEIKKDSLIITFDRKFNGVKTLRTYRNKDETLLNGTSEKALDFYVKIKRVTNKVD